MSTVAGARPRGRQPNRTMHTPAAAVVANSQVMRWRWPPRADSASEMTPPDGRENRLSSPDTAARPPPTVWDSLKWFW
jgi:hypothetical protein